MIRMSNYRITMYTAFLCFCITLVFVYPLPGMAVEEGQPLEGVSFIDGITQNGKSMLIDEYRYQLTPKTRYFSQDGKPASSEKFISGMLVAFVANEKGELLSLREEFDLEGEFARKRDGQNNLTESHGDPKRQEQRTIKKKSTLHFENGVWEN